jgi:type II secretory pathway pseudopilin PulG
MLMKSLGTNAGNRRRRESGFSLAELLIVMMVIIIMSAITAVSLRPLMAQQQMSNAFNTTLGALRQARDNSVAQSTSFQVTFQNNAGAASTIVVTPTTAFGVDQSGNGTGGLTTYTYTLPTSVTFQIPGVAVATAPDGYGTGAVAIDLGYTANGGVGGSNTVYFCPDGSAQTVACITAGGYTTTGGYATNWDGGVVYLGYAGNPQLSRAFTLWGGTGRIRGWRLNLTGGVYQWQRI